MLDSSPSSANLNLNQIGPMVIDQVEFYDFYHY